MQKDICNQCGCTIDQGEKLHNCQLITGEQPERRFVTYADWEAAGDFNKVANPGDYVEECIVDEMRDCVPPASMRAGYFQVGEPYSHEYDPEEGRWRGTYATFARDMTGWKYCGNCFIGNFVEPQKPVRTEATV